MKKYFISLLLLFTTLQSHSVIFVFDDGWKSAHHEATPLLTQYGYTGVVSIIPELVGTRSHISWGQVYELQRQGWKIWNHSLNHVNLNTLSLGDVKTNVLTSQEIFKRHNIYPEVFVPPYGELSPERIAIIAPYFKGIRMAWESPDYKYPLYSALEVKHGQIGVVKQRLLADPNLVLFMHKIEYTNDMNYSITREELNDLLQFCYFNNIKITSLGDK